ncbi:MAG: PssD/Cps14F family polysaccharide biosynthesis glycosyltransferase [archaeon]|nr:PssD/Cps14F family polysaccharide biosynthesis glycosyltransferase [archaeon]
MKTLVVLGMGGHTAQVLRLLQLIGDNYDYEYVVGHDDKTSVSKIKHSGKIYLIRNPRLMKDKSIVKVFFNMFFTTIAAWKILSKSKPDVIIGAGPAICIPLFWIAKLNGIKTIFIESWVRVSHKSNAGRLVYPVSDLFFVQWRSMKKVYPKSIYAGRLS